MTTSSKRIKEAIFAAACAPSPASSPAPAASVDAGTRPREGPVDLERIGRLAPHVEDRSAREPGVIETSGR